MQKLRGSPRLGRSRQSGRSALVSLVAVRRSAAVAAAVRVAVPELRGCLRLGRGRQTVLFALGPLVAARRSPAVAASVQLAAQEPHGNPRLGRGQPAVRPALGPLAAGHTMAAVARVTSLAAPAGGRDSGLRQPAGHLGADGACDTPSVLCGIGDGGVSLPRTPLVTQGGGEATCHYQACWAPGG